MRERICFPVRKSVVYGSESKQIYENEYLFPLKKQVFQYVKRKSK